MDVRNADSLLRVGFCFCRDGRMSDSLSDLAQWRRLWTEAAPIPG